MIKKIKWGVIGSGGIAQRRTIPEGIIPAVNAELVSVYDVNTKLNAEVASKFGVKAASSIDGLLASDADAVYIATPANFHCQQVIECAKAKKHILCEKPLGMTIKETQKMIAVCKKAKVQLGTAFMMRFHSQHQAALAMIKAGKIGKPVYARAQLSCWYPPIKNAWRQDPFKGGGGALMDMGSHCIDLLEMFLGKIKKINCFINNSVQKYESEDSAVATLFFENGAIGTIDTFFCIPDNCSKNVLELYGSKGSIYAKGTIGQGQAGEMIAYFQQSSSGYDAKQQRKIADGVLISPKPLNMYLSEIEEFSQAIIEKRKPLSCIEIGNQNLKILAACYKSARTGKVINIY